MDLLTCDAVSFRGEGAFSMEPSSDLGPGMQSRRSGGWTKGVSTLQRLHSVVRPQLGSSLQAIAIPLKQGAGEPESVLLYFGIIDFLQVRQASWVKATV